MTRGRPAAQHYVYVRAACNAGCNDKDPGWTELALPEICGDACPKPISEVENARTYAVGPPTILHIDDWRRLAPLWCNYSVHVRARAQMKNGGNAFLKEGEKVYIAEMLAYSLAAAVLELPHQVHDAFTTDTLDACQYSDKLISPAKCQPPRIIHYCYPQNTMTPFGRWVWNKYRMPIGYGMTGEDQWRALLFSDCAMPLLEVPPSDSASPASWRDEQERHIMWMIREIVAAYNGGTLALKRQHCDPTTIETRELLRVTEDFAYVPAESLRDGARPLHARVQHLVREGVKAGSWKGV